MKPLRKYIQSLLEEFELGNQVFADRAPYGPHYGSEKDTELEKELWYALSMHMGGERGGVSKYLTKALQRSILAFTKDPHYNDVFGLYKDGNAYRGMAVPVEWLDQNVPKWHEVPGAIPAGVKKWTVPIPASLKFVPRDGTVSSWTPTINVAKSFAGGRRSDEDYAIVLIANSGANKFLDLKELYRYHGLEEWEWENEIIGFGPIQANGVMVLK